ncbi:MAG: hypothetical protein R2845_02305 [Thermomicrobiales bacterium]
MTALSAVILNTDDRSNCAELVSSCFTLDCSNDARSLVTESAADLVRVTELAWTEFMRSPDML